MISDKIQLIQGDITKIIVDAVVNAAKSSLLGGGGVDGAIHKAAGLELLEECKTLGGCKTGEAKITRGYNLPASHVIHTVGPIWKEDSGVKEEMELWSCYYNSLALARRRGLRTIAFPNISTGIYGFPKEKAVEKALEGVKFFFKHYGSNAMDKIMFVCFDDENFNLYNEAIKKLKEEEEKRMKKFVLICVIIAVLTAIIGSFFVIKEIMQIHNIKTIVQEKPKIMVVNYYYIDVLVLVLIHELLYNDYHQLPTNPFHQNNLLSLVIRIPVFESYDFIG